jgi:hypothetical protein
MIQYDAQNLRICPDVGVPLPACQLPLPLFVAKVAGAIAGEVKMCRTWYKKLCLRELQALRQTENSLSF